MTVLTLLSAGGVTAPSRLDPLQLFFDADIVVQLVILGLILASIWVWTIVFSFSTRLRGLERRNRYFEEDFWSSEHPETLVGGRRKKDNSSARVAAAGLAELQRSTKGGVRDPDGVRARVAQAMEGQVAEESDNLASRLGFLATTGSVAPFVGLFGTVWGIMNSFFQIGMQQTSSLAVVAPGISEALFATAIGLFAAIPAVIAYNRFSGKVNAFEARLQRFADRVHAQISRELEAA
jgi:biopolymer transport protein TolQ